jgi:FtsP/CotA-like multicopper oxidase with cupredoxin domain
MMALEMILDFNTPAASMRDMAAIDPRLVSFEADPAAQGGTEASRSNIFTPFSIRGSRVTVEAFAYNKQVPGPTLRVTQGDRVRINVTNRLPEDTTVHWHGLPGDGDDQHEGGQLLKIRFVGSNTTAIHPMHIHGGPFEVAAVDGETLPKSARYTADTVNVGPGQRFDVLWRALRPGKWLLHCHIPHHTTNNQCRGEERRRAHGRHRCQLTRLWPVRCRPTKYLTLSNARTRRIPIAAYQPIVA